MFTASEATAIVSYLTCKAATDAITDFEKGRIREALDNYWAGRAA